MAKNCRLKETLAVSQNTERLLAELGLGGEAAGKWGPWIATAGLGARWVFGGELADAFRSRHVDAESLIRFRQE